MNDKIAGSEFIGKVAIRHGSEFSEPLAVYVSGISSMFEDAILSKQLNSGNIVFGGTFEEFNFKKLQLLRQKWEIENAKRKISKGLKLIKEMEDELDKR